MNVFSSGGLRHAFISATSPLRNDHMSARLVVSVNNSFRFHVPRRISTRSTPYWNSVPSKPIFLASDQPALPSIPILRSSPSSTVSPLWRSSLQPAIHHARLPCASPTISLYFPNAWKLPVHARRAFHITRNRLEKSPEDTKSHTTSDKNLKKLSEESAVPPAPPEHHESFYERIHMPHLPHFHRPTKEELLAMATGFWSRLRMRFKWYTIKSARPFNVDEIFGFLSWLVLGHVVWIIVGTTTFFSLAILAINTVFAQETLARWIGNYLTKSSGLKVVFESAIVPKWNDGVITFKNVFVSRRPGQPKDTGVRKGSPEAEAVAASAEDHVAPEDQNYTQFDITLGEVNVTLSFSKWWNSKGLLKNVEIKHVRGVIDRTHVYWSDEPYDPKAYRHEHTPGDFEIETFKIEDLLVTLHQPSGFRPFPVSIYNAELPRLRKQWMFYDFLNANNMTGEYDRSIFTIHPRQTHSFTGVSIDDPSHHGKDPWKKHSRIRLDGLNIDHLNRGVSGPFSWIHEGNVDIIADIMIPEDNDESVMKVMSDFYDRMEATLTSRKLLEHHNNSSHHHLGHDDEPSMSSQPRYVPTDDNNVDANIAVTSAYDESLHKTESEEDKRFLIMDLRIHLNDVRAVVPLFTRDLSYINNALIRPIVGYINSRRTFIPINCRVVKRAIDFDGSWTIYDSGLMDDLSAEVYEAFARDVTDEQARIRRFKKVGLWSLQLAAQAIFLGMAGNIV